MKYLIEYKKKNVFKFNINLVFYFYTQFNIFLIFKFFLKIFSVKTANNNLLIFRVVRNGEIVFPPRIIKNKLMDIHILVFYVLNEEITNYRQCKYDQIGDFDDFGCIVNVTIHVLNNIYYFNVKLKQ